MRKFYLWIALFFAFAIGSTWFLRKTIPKQSVRVYPALATSIPADTKILVGFQIEKLKQTRLYQKLVDERKLPAIDRFAQETGIDLRKNIYEIVFASNGRDTIVLASGKFAELSSSTGQSTSELRPQAQIQGERMVAMPYKGLTLIGNPNAAACFLNNATVMAGPTEVLKRVIDLKEKSPMPPLDLLNAARELPNEDQFWLVSTLGIDRTIAPLSVGGMKLNQIPVKVDRILGSGKVGLGFHLDVKAESSDAKSLEQIHGGLKAVLAFARLSTDAKETDLMRLYDGVRVDADTKSVRIQTDVPEALIERFLNSSRAFTSSGPESRRRD